MNRVRIVLELEDEQMQAIARVQQREGSTAGSVRDYLTRVVCSHLDLIVTNMKADQDEDLKAAQAQDQHPMRTVSVPRLLTGWAYKAAR